jgi:hypothetical protein
VIFVTEDFKKLVHQDAHYGCWKSDCMWRCCFFQWETFNIYVLNPQHRKMCLIQELLNMYLRENVCEGAGLIHLAQDRVPWQVFVNTVMNFQVPKKAGNFLIKWVTITFLYIHPSNLELVTYNWYHSQGRIMLYNSFTWIHNQNLGNVVMACITWLSKGCIAKLPSGQVGRGVLAVWLLSSLWHQHHLPDFMYLPPIWTRQMVFTQISNSLVKCFILSYYEIPKGNETRKNWGQKILT